MKTGIAFHLPRRDKLNKLTDKRNENWTILGVEKSETTIDTKTSQGKVLKQHTNNLEPGKQGKRCSPILFSLLLGYPHRS